MHIAFCFAWNSHQAGLDHYSDVIDSILSAGMIPIVTLLHSDTPLQFYGSNLSSAADPH